MTNGFRVTGQQPPPVQTTAPQAQPVRNRRHAVRLAHPIRVRSRAAQRLPPARDLRALQARLDQQQARQVMANLPNRPNPAPQGHISVRHPRGYDLTIPRQSLPQNLQGRSLPQLQQDIQQKVDRGVQLLDDVSQGRIDPDQRPCTPRDMTDILWALQTTSEHKLGHSWKEGAISVEDPQGRLRGFLDSCPDSYQRQSTHVDGFQSQQHGFPRGMDVYGSATNTDQLLPNGRQTLLYQAMGTQDTRGAKGMPRNMLLLKMESYGCFSSRNQRPDRGPVRQANRHDRDAFRGHVGTTVQSLLRRITGRNTPTGSHKERLSSGTTKAYNSLANHSIFRRDNMPAAVRQILQRNHPTSQAGGLRIMHQNINDASAHLRRQGGHQGEIERLQQFQFQHIVSNGQQDHLDVRIGNEVILTRSELSPTPIHAQGTTAQRVTQNANGPQLRSDFKDSLVDGMTSTREDSTMRVRQSNVCEQFVSDFAERTISLSIDGNFVPFEPAPPAHTERGGRRIQALRDFCTTDGRFDARQCEMLSRVVNQMSHGSLQGIIEGPPPTRVGDPPDARQDGPWSARQGTQIMPDGGAQARTHFSLKREPDGSIRIFGKTTQPLAGVMSGMNTDAPRMTMFNQPGQHASATRSYEVRIPPGSHDPNAIEVLDVGYQMSTSD